MKKFKVLNLYACLGGNRYKWDEVAEQANIKLDVTAVELDPDLAKLYKERFPNDKVVVADAKDYLLDHYKEFCFVWASPPCPSHSRIRFGQAKSDKRKNYNPVYPDFSLYEQIVFLDKYFIGKYCVENVIPFYKPLIPAQKRGRHLYWCNFKLPPILSDRKVDKNWIETSKKISDFHGITDLLKLYTGKQRKDIIAHDLVDYEAGRTIFETALNITRSNNIQQSKLF